LRGRFFVVGSDPKCALRLSETGVSPQHAQLRQVGRGFEVRDLGSASGTYVQGAALTAPILLSDGDRLRLGQAELEFQNPRERRQAAPFLRDVERRLLAAPLVDALVRLQHPSVGLHLLDTLTGDPDARARDVCALEAVLGRAAAAALGARLEASARARSASTAAQLQALTQQQARSESDWFLWWDSVRLNALPQVVPPRTGSLTLRVTAGIAPAEFSLGDEGVLLVGRDAKCHVRLDNRSVSRLHTTLLRLNERFLVRDEGRASGTLLNGQRVRLAPLKAGDELTIGEVCMTVVASDPIPNEHAEARVHPQTFAALAEAGHPSIAAALVSRLDGAAQFEALSKLPVPVECDAPKLQAALRSLLHERATQALGLLPRLLGCQLGDDPAAWRAHLVSARAQLPPQVRVWPAESA
jgi:pSer/pThr/pTyr-binding forkhead associated (FHA) protein